ncbi:MAG TPA: 16S rRNA (cytosine(1402)-N(4))-methyltransferase RsmH [Smithella sp.]|nr:16S rRNA (cytosine(1402)-N(4))-methyltransferase RsmH [Smithella sp.]
MITVFYHEPVMLKEVTDSLLVSRNGVYVDCTVGGAGHAYEILKKTDAFLIGIDCDEEALHFAGKRLKEFGSRKVLIKENFVNLNNILKNLNIKKVDGVLLDLGVSSRQLDAVSRGFSFSQQAPLDMRMDRSLKLSAYDIVNRYAQDELEKIIRLYGEEKMAARIARAISQKRRESPIETTTQLAAIAASCMPAKLKWQKIHPATRTFQAIRIAVNHELDNIKPAIDAAADVLNPGGRLCVISFHSLEDRIVKREIRDLEGGCVCPPDIPVCICRREAKLKNLTRKAVTPTAEEIENNPRARSAKLRVAGRI